MAVITSPKNALSLISFMLIKYALPGLAYTVIALFPGTLGAQLAEPTVQLAQTHKVEAEQKAEKIKEETVEREAGEDPLVKQASDKQESDKIPYQYQDHTSARAYGSARVRYSATDIEDDFSDGGSRVGLDGELQFRPKFWLFGRAEVGFNLLDSVGRVLNASERASDEDRNVSARLFYGGIQTPKTTTTYGKNWSTYYQVSSITDRFASFGAEASGTFNASTDGGKSGTGRADNVLQGRFSLDTLPTNLGLKPFKLNIQMQDGEDVPHVSSAQYSHSLGISALLESKSEKVIGIAYNQAFIHDDDLPALKAQGIHGDSKALVLGTRRFGDRYYLGTTLSLLKNQEATDENLYFDGWGWEAFGSYNFSKRWWGIGGWNILEPHSDQLLAGDYRLRYGVLGLRYTFDEFRRMIYSEIRIDDSRRADGTQPGNVYTLGIRWDFPR